jgi:uncharacterized protein (TIGR02646 family)
MIQMPSRDLPADAQTKLREYQQTIDEQPEYAQRVALAKINFGRYNTPKNPTFRQVRIILAEMCSGAQRCCYCEDSVADEIEHIYPKDLYPEKVFVWTNYLYACGPCNSPKNNQFAVIIPATKQLCHVNRLKDAPIVSPQIGQSALIDPRCEDPLNYLELDLQGTFYFNVRIGLNPTDRLRAEYTRDVLRLNERDYLVEARRRFYETYRARLNEYIQHRDHGVPQSQLETHIAALKKVGHPTVWREMQRQRALIAELADLFSQAPEALAW